MWKNFVETLIQEYSKGKKIHEILNEYGYPITYKEAVMIIRKFIKEQYKKGETTCSLSKKLRHSKSTIYGHIKRSGIKVYRWGKIHKFGNARVTTIPLRFFKFTPHGAKWWINEKTGKVMVEFHPEQQYDDYSVYIATKGGCYLYVPVIIPKNATHRRWIPVKINSKYALFIFEWKVE